MILKLINQQNILKYQNQANHVNLFENNILKPK